MDTSGRILICSAAVLAGAAAATAAPLLDLPQQFAVRGTGDVTIAGPGCCGDSRFRGSFRAAYQIAASGQVTLASLHLSLADSDTTVHGGFLGLFSQTIRLRCTEFGEKRAALGTVSGSELRFPAGAVAIEGFGAESRLDDGSCGPVSLGFEGANDTLLRIVHDPAANRVQMNATFTGTADGGTYTFTARATGTFENRPPVAAMQFETPAAPQGLGCPAVYQPNLGFVAEANDPGGLKAVLRSSSGDPDGGAAGSGADLLSQRWYRWRDDGPRSLAGVDYRTAPQVFEWGPRHSVEIVSMDRAGAASAAQCAFRVVDTRPPTVTPPAPVVVACSQANGASYATSPALQAFLLGGSASDIADASPTRLSPQLSPGVNVTTTTVFPGNGIARPVTFRFQDDAGNVGSAAATVTVLNAPPSLTVSLSPANLPSFPPGAFHAIQATLTASDCGGPVTLRLHEISSNAPAYDATDITGASIGTDDREFGLRARLAPNGKPRVYRVTYSGTDSSGLVTYVTATVKVG